MKAVRLHRFGGPEVLQYETLPDPRPGAGEVLIRNQAAGVNPIDWKTRSGGGARPFLGEPPLILGWEFAGEVAEIGPEVSDWSEGRRVCGLLNFPHPGSCYADRVVARSSQLVALPDGVAPEVAAGLPIAGMTAWQALFEAAELESSHKVLVLAAAGGVGHLAVQLAHWKGATVVGTASPVNHAYLQELGCSQVVDYVSADLASAVQDCDLVIDGVGGQAGIEALGCLKPGGLLVTLPTVTADEVVKAAQEQGLKAQGIRVHEDPAQLATLLALVADGHLKPRVERTFALSEAAEAHRLSESGHARGKLILTMEG
ncbi:NADP-dependent oxidoreductase [Motiliproteus sp. SC1-56]|uniref:NADP-dependent oxidoreductase n=1 Tax=Motiliproteus sp. SC1-56 TaxID=2799565 RepID=UPI001A908C70|nr:NADP-dependent oxidoreductase [Motiliproteus sp. SC1-56]